MMVPATAEQAAAIIRPVYEYAYGIDTNDFELYRSIFTDEVTMDFSSYDGSSGPKVLPADDWVAGLKPLFTGLDSTQHSMSNPLVDIDAEASHARCRMYMQAVHMLDSEPDPEFTIGGYYDDLLARTPDGWKIKAVTLTVWWRRGNPQIMELARTR